MKTIRIPETDSPFTVRIGESGFYVSDGETQAGREDGTPFESISEAEEMLDWLENMRRTQTT